MLSSKEASLLAALEPRAEAEGIEIVTVEVVGSRKAPTIRVYLDTPELFAWTMVILIVSMIFEKIFLAALDKAVSWVERM